MKLGTIYALGTFLLILIYLLLRVFGLSKENANKTAENIVIGIVVVLVAGLILVTIFYS